MTLRCIRNTGEIFLLAPVISNPKYATASNQKEFLNLYYKDETDQRNIELKKRPSPR